MERMVIQFRGASLQYGPERRALLKTSADIGPGLTLILGPNGAGKSSLLKLAAGVERPMEGQVLVDGHDLWVDEVRARRCLAYVPEYPDLTPYATVAEVMQLVCRLREVPASHGDAALLRAGLAREADRTIRELSMGQRRRALLASAFIGDPPNVLLDEPLEGMDRAMQDELVAWVVSRVATGATVLIATHEIEPFVAHASRAIAVRDGTAVVLDVLPDAPARRLERLLDLARGRD